jgi:MHS family proline/betaine transporter-like MFS transporter
VSGKASAHKIGAASIGQFGEIYDFAVFGFSVPVIAAHFFPAGDPNAAILSTFAVYAVAFFARPVGGLIFGFLADRIGRIAVLAITIWLMAAGTALIGLLPTYSSIGIMAPLLLVACRLAQGFAIGGETTGATSFILESAPSHERGRWVGIIWFWAHVPNAAVALMLVVLQLAVGKEAYADWVWRVPFVVGGLIGIVGYWMRRTLDDPEEYREARAEAPAANPLAAAGTSGLRSMLYVLLIQPVQTIGSYLLLGFMYTFLVREAKLDPTLALTSNAAAILVLSAVIPFAGKLSDRIGRKPVLIAGAAWILLLSYPAILLAASGTLAGVVVGQLLVAIGIGLYDGPAFTAAVEFFPTSFRATGHAVAYQLTVAIFGGTTPLVASWLVSHFGTPLAPGFYVMAIAALGLIGLRFVPETARISLRHAVYDEAAGQPELVGLSGLSRTTGRAR